MRLLPEDPVRRGRAKLLLLAGFFALPMVLSVLAYRYDWAPGTAGNYGELIAPRVLPDVALPALGGASLRVSRLRGKWVLVQFDAPACDPRCERKLYFMRQVRRAMGRDMERIERVWILDAEGTPSAALQAGAEGTRLLRDPDGSFGANFPAATARRDHLYLIDPQGNLMMRFPPDPDPSRIIKDLQKLLKFAGG